MKLSFSIHSKSSSSSTSSKHNLKHSQTFTDNNKDQNDNDTTLELLTEFDSSKPRQQNSNKNLVIPPIQNSWQPRKRLKNLEELPSLNASQNDTDQPRFEVVSDFSSTNPDDSNISYGLNLRDGSKRADEQLPRGDGGDGVESQLLQKLKEDLERLPEDNALEEYEEVPVDGFGAALLKGYGWTEGRGVGKNAKEDVKVVQYERRGDREGIGFQPKKEKGGSGTGGSGRGNGEGSVHMDIIEDRRGPKEGNGSMDIDGRRDHKGRSESEDINERKGLVEGSEYRGIGGRNYGRDGKGGEGRHYLVGKDVRVIEGRDVGLKGRVLEVGGDSKVSLNVSGSREELRVRIEQVALLGSREEEKCVRKLKELKISQEERKNVSKSSLSEGNRVSSKKGTSRERVSWLRNHIRVRVISKDLKRGRLYLKKGQVVDVVGPTTCDITMDESGELVQGVDQDILETALPHKGGPVLVLYGKHKGVYGSLVERDLDKETAVVQDADSHELLNVRLEQIAEYIGDPSYIGY